MTPVSSPPRTWSPILEGEEAARATAAVDAVAAALGHAPLPDRNAGASLAGGEAGVALFFAFLDRARPGAGYGEIAEQRLEKAIEALSSSTQSVGLYSGFTGVSWVLEHLQDGPAEEDDPSEDIDATLLDHLRQTPWTQHYDLIAGLAGYGVYALERLPRPSAAACLELVVERLAEIAQPRPGGVCWYTPYELIAEPNRPYYPLGYENLGVAHGTPGVIGSLARICASGVAVERARPLLADAVSWLLAQKLPEGERSVFPYMVGTEVLLRPARAGWCYGDPGIAAVLLAAGRAAGEPAWEREAIDLARAVARRPPEVCRVDDAGLCHGAAGLGHLLGRLYQATGDPELLAASRAWFGRALGYWEPGQGIGGFLSYSPPDDDFNKLIWREDAGFLNGSAGVALALLAATSAVDPSWDRVLLLSPLAGESAG
ncbi:MAG TPA: lanthionine synthetase C family protein [Thermoanaerobaculia bacterium]|nr:lanthionine synthetase C family protein [Thermoanaerobaculia bacterium]